MLGIVDAGGGMRGVYSSGIYDCLLKENVRADYCLGVSAGSANLITYVANQMGRTRRFYSIYSMRSEYMGGKNFLKKGSFIDLDYVFSVLTNEGGEDPLDYDALMNNPTRFLCAATRACDGESVFFTKDDVKRNDYGILKASCCIPVVNRPVKVYGQEYYDGGIAEPIPFKKAFEDGCDKVVVVLTKPREDYTVEKKTMSLGSKILKKYPKIGEEMATLPERCKQLLDELSELENQGKVYVFEPDDCMGAETLTRNRHTILRLYTKGYNDALKAINHSDFFSFLKS